LVVDDNPTSVLLRRDKTQLNIVTLTRQLRHTLDFREREVLQRIDELAAANREQKA